ncbi:hypothetical protein PZ938_04395 [Luteipulveratus sp. YIM 133132]|uniref:HAAS signaling domain-containing protein n=1 Tax=Luteipulveratus flavus TaxID=3031728 RepID=UPI0023B185C6|nr:hypothetical protein [Luteipulveratus sp. YIM 133132]MDE9364835.1 hypothetical protein [Luteipulveratus sp. YIM 133132]
MSTVVDTDAATAYRERVGAALADLPAEERDDLLEDVAEHLAELSVELGDPSAAVLEQRLGTPEQYAAELRTAAGCQNPASTARNGRARLALTAAVLSTLLLPLLVVGWVVVNHSHPFRDLLAVAVVGLAPAALGLLAVRGQDVTVVARLEVWQLGTRVVRRAAAASPEWFVRELRAVGQPVWWALRGALVGAAAYFVLIEGRPSRATVPKLVIPVLLTAIASVWLARRAQQDRRWLFLLVPANAAVLLSLMMVLMQGTSFWTGGYVEFHPRMYGW